MEVLLDQNFYGVQTRTLGAAQGKNIAVDTGEMARQDAVLRRRQTPQSLTVGADLEELIIGIRQAND
jgi:hypothetical protein